MGTRRAFGFVFLLGLVACGAHESPKPPAAPIASPEPRVPATPQKSGDPFVLEPPVLEEPFNTRVPPVDFTKVRTAIAASKVAPPAKSCAAYAARKTKGTCTDRATAIALLDRALAEPEPNKRDAALVLAEACTVLPAGLVRALRAEAAPAECADAIVDPALDDAANRASPEIQHALAGWSLAGRLRRTVQNPPPFSPPESKERIKRYIEGPFKAWVTEQARSIEELSKAASQLASHGRVVAAGFAAMADWAFVVRAREVPVPAEYKTDPELRDVYYGSLDAFLEPRKTRARDALLVSMREAARDGGFVEVPVEPGALLDEAYAGKRLRALSHLMVPSLNTERAPATSAEGRVALRLSTFYTGLLFEPAELEQPAMLDVFVMRGIPARMRAKLDRDLAEGKLPPRMRSLYARIRLQLGRLYSRRVDFDQAALLASGSREEDDRLILALALALRQGPNGKDEELRAEARYELNLHHVEALDRLAESASPHSGMAAFNAALLRFVAPPDKSSAESADYFRSVADRFEKAALLFEKSAKEGAAAREARQFAEQARATSASISRPRP